MVTAFGVQEVSCPFCRARVGRPCSTRRGWLVGGAHEARRAAWAAFLRVPAA